MLIIWEDSDLCESLIIYGRIVIYVNYWEDSDLCELIYVRRIVIYVNYWEDSDLCESLGG